MHLSIDLHRERAMPLTEEDRYQSKIEGMHKMVPLVRKYHQLKDSHKLCCNLPGVSSYSHRNLAMGVCGIRKSLERPSGMLE